MAVARSWCVLLLVMLAACGVLSDPDAPSRELLDALRAKQAGREEIAASMKGTGTVYAPGTEEWDALLQFLGREPAPFTCRCARP